MANEIIFEIKERIGVLASFNNGWNKEINRVSWNGNPAKYDIRFLHKSVWCTKANEIGNRLSRFAFCSIRHQGREPERASA